MQKVMDAEGVDTMVKHKIQKGVPPSLSMEWEPPIHSVLATNINISAGAVARGGVARDNQKILHKRDMLFLMDKCFERIFLSGGGLPDADLYLFIADVCILNENNPEFQARKTCLVGNLNLPCACFVSIPRIRHLRLWLGPALGPGPSAGAHPEDGAR